MDAGYPREEIRQIQSCKLKTEECKDDKCIKHEKTTHALYVDDLSELEAIDLKQDLIADMSQRTFPLKYHERTGQILKPNSRLQQNLNKIELFTESNLMRINIKKTNVMLFNPSKSLDFPPDFAFRNGELLDCVDECKLLGVYLQSNLKWDLNTTMIYKKAMSKIWLLRRMKTLKLETETILEYYVKEIRPLVEHGVPVWNSGLTKGQVRQLERIQKVALYIILDEKDLSYNEACSKFNLKSLSERREDLCLNFATKLYKSERSSEFFTPAVRKSRRPNLVIESFCRTKRAKNAPHNYLGRILNENSVGLL